MGDGFTFNSNTTLSMQRPLINPEGLVAETNYIVHIVLYVSSYLSTEICSTRVCRRQTTFLHVMAVDHGSNMDDDDDNDDGDDGYCDDDDSGDHVFDNDDDHDDADDPCNDHDNGHDHDYDEDDDNQPVLVDLFRWTQRARMNCKSRLNSQREVFF